MLYPPNKQCLALSCLHTLKGMHMMHAQQWECILYTVSNGPLPVYSVHLACKDMSFWVPQLLEFWLMTAWWQLVSSTTITTTRSSRVSTHTTKESPISFKSVNINLSNGKSLRCGWVWWITGKFAFVNCCLLLIWFVKRHLHQRVLISTTCQWQRPMNPHTTGPLDSHFPLTIFGQHSYFIAYLRMWLSGMSTSLSSTLGTRRIGSLNFSKDTMNACILRASQSLHIFVTSVPTGFMILMAKVRHIKLPNMNSFLF